MGRPTARRPAQILLERARRERRVERARERIVALPQDVVIADARPWSVQRRQPLRTRLDLLAERPLEVGVALEADLANEPQHGGTGDAGALGQLRQALEPGRGIGREQRARHPSLGRRHLPEPFADLLADRLARVRHGPLLASRQDSYASRRNERKLVTELDRFRRGVYECRIGSPIRTGGRGMLRRSVALAFVRSPCGRRMQHLEHTTSGGSASGSASGAPDRDRLPGRPVDGLGVLRLADGTRARSSPSTRSTTKGGVLGRPLELKTVDMRNDVAEARQGHAAAARRRRRLPDRHRG